MAAIPDIGARIRGARQRRQLSLTEVADRVGLSVATLSRIETSKQSIDVTLLMTLARIYGVAPGALLGDGDGGQDVEGLTERLATLRAADRAKVIQSAGRRRRADDLATVVEDLMATLEMVREELEQVARATRKLRKR